MKDKKASNFGVFIIIIGLAILLINLNILKISMFWGIVDLWPILLIIAGVSILFRKIKYVNAILWLIFIGVVIGYSYLNINDKSWAIGNDVEHITESTVVNTSYGNGIIDLDINQGSFALDTDAIEEIKYTIPKTGVEAKVVTNTDEVNKLIIKDDQNVDFVKTFQKRNYEVQLPNNVSWEAKIDGGVVSMDLDFSEVKLNDLDIDIGVGDLKLYLGEASEGTYNIDFGIGDVTIILPDNPKFGLRIISDSGLTSFSSPKDFDEKNNVYTSANYETAEMQMTIYIDVGIGSIEVK